MNQLEQENQRHEAAVHAIADELFAQKCKRYFDRHCLHMLTGNGTYYIYDSHGKSIYHDDLPKSIRAVLELTAPDGYELGSWMSDYHWNGKREG